MKSLLIPVALDGRWTLAGLLVILVTLAGCGKKPASQDAASQAANPTNVAASTPAKSGVDMKVIEGKWVRSDAEYMLDVKAPDASGKVQVTYFNPRPINVAKAEAKVEDGVVKLFVELQDVGYPGCTYKLTYIKDRDALAGVYYQAAMQQSYDIMFMRLK